MAQSRKEKRPKPQITQHLLKITVDGPGVVAGTDTKSKRIYVTVNAFAFSVNQAELRFERLETLLKEFHSREIETKELDPRHISIDMGYEKRNEIVAIAWDVIDWLERSRKIFGAITGIPKKNDFYSATMKLLEPAERFRQILQHYDSEVVGVAVTDSFPIMGSVIATFKLGDSWVGRVLLSTPARYAGDKDVCVAGAKFVEKNIQGDVDGVILSVANHSVNLSDTIRELRKEQRRLAEHLKSTFSFEWPSI